MKTAVLVLLAAAAGVLFLAPAAEAQPRPPAAAARADASTLTMQFDNSLKAVSEDKRQKVIDTIAKYVCLVPPGQVKYVSGINQGGALTKQSVVVFECVGPTTNRKTTLANCQENTKGRWLGLRDSVATAEIKKATDTWWPNDKVEIEKATCAKTT